MSAPDDLTQWQRQRDERQALLTTVERYARDFDGGTGGHWTAKADRLRGQVADLDARIGGVR